MTDRQFANPLKETVSPLVKIVPGYACHPQRLEANSKLEMLYRLAITQMKNRLPPSAVTTSAQIHLKYDLTSALLQDAEVKWTFVVCYVFLFNLSCDLPERSPFLYYSKTSAVRNSNVGSSITS